MFYYIERHFKKLFTVIITGELTNRSWHLYQKCFVVSLDIDDFTFIAHAQKRRSKRFNDRKNVSATTPLRDLYRLLVWSSAYHLPEAFALLDVRFPYGRDDQDIPNVVFSFLFMPNGIRVFQNQFQNHITKYRVNGILIYVTQL